MSAHVPGCTWDKDRGCYTAEGDGCVAPEEHRKWRNPTWCAACGEQIVYVAERHRCPPEEPSRG